MRGRVSLGGFLAAAALMVPAAAGAATGGRWVLTPRNWDFLKGKSSVTPPAFPILDQGTPQ